MTNKPPEPKLICGDALNDLLKGADIDEDAEAVSDYIASKMKQAGCKIHNDTPIDIAFKYGKDTHNIAFYTWPIEEEVKECDHKLEYTFNPPLPDAITGAFFGYVARINKDDLIYCPKCGKALS